MLRKLTFFVGVSLCIMLAAPKVYANFLFGPNDVQKALTAPEISVGKYTLDKDGLTQFYTARDFHYAWQQGKHGEEAKFNAFLDSVDRIIAYNGLERENYAIDLMRHMATDAENEDNVENGVKLELLATDTLLHLAKDLHGDDVNLAELYPGWTFHRAPIDIPARLVEAVASGKLDDFFTSLTPKAPAYTMLASILPTFKAITERGGWPMIATGPSLRPGDHGIRVGQLRARLAAEGYVELKSNSLKKNNIFDSGLSDALEAFQKRNGLKADGHAGRLTQESLNIPAAVRVNQILANMERWRHMPEEYPGSRFVVVNIPAMTIEIVEDSKSVYSGIVIVGRVDRKTPFINSTIRSMIINPSWHVPLKIAQKDILPKLRKDPNYLEKLGFVIVGNDADPFGENIDWNAISENQFNFRLRQAPGDMNSLGHIKFDFNNDFAVYMHDTPHQELFDKPDRALSSGCVRLHDPAQVAEIITSSNKEPWTSDHIQDEIAGSKTRWVGIAKPFPIFFLYWTVFTDEDGKVNFRKDIYDYDRFLMASLIPSDANSNAPQNALAPGQRSEKIDDSVAH